MSISIKWHNFDNTERELKVGKKRGGGTMHLKGKENLWHNKH